MTEQQVTTKGTTASEALSWQFILLLVVIAILIPVVSASFNNVERAARPVPTPEPIDFSSEAYQALNNLALDQTYDDASGISLSHPTGWFVLQLSSGYFVLSNYALDLNALEFPEDIVLVQVQTGPLSSFTLPDNTTPESGTSPRALMEVVIADSPDPIEIIDRPVGEAAGASIHLEDADTVRELLLITPTADDLVLVEASAAAGLWPNVSGLLGRIIDSMTFSLPSE